ncbi:MAG: hypothetical protein Q8R28_18330, partial [Dehalococcoidia bacterium]|nr:hypothetical protein [Dehalococcoidia bacterium]
MPPQPGAPPSIQLPPPPPAVPLTPDAIERRAYRIGLKRQIRVLRYRLKTRPGDQRAPEWLVEVLSLEGEEASYLAHDRVKAKRKRAQAREAKRAHAEARKLALSAISPYVPHVCPPYTPASTLATTAGLSYPLPPPVQEWTGPTAEDCDWSDMRTTWGGAFVCLPLATLAPRTPGSRAMRVYPQLLLMAGNRGAPKDLLRGLTFWHVARHASAPGNYDGIFRPAPVRDILRDAGASENEQARLYAAAVRWGFVFKHPCQHNKFSVLSAPKTAALVFDLCPLPPSALPEIEAKRHALAHDYRAILPVSTTSRAYLLALIHQVIGTGKGGIAAPRSRDLVTALTGIPRRTQTWLESQTDPRYLVVVDGRDPTDRLTPALTPEPGYEPPMVLLREPNFVETPVPAAQLAWFRLYADKPHAFAFDGHVAYETCSTRSLPNGIPLPGKGNLRKIKSAVAGTAAAQSHVTVPPVLPVHGGQTS